MERTGDRLLGRHGPDGAAAGDGVRRSTARLLPAALAALGVGGGAATGGLRARDPLEPELLLPKPDLLENPDQELVHIVLDPDGSLDEFGTEGDGQFLAL